MNTRERLDAMVQLALESRDNSRIRSNPINTQACGKLRPLPVLESILDRAKSKSSNNSNRVNYTYGL